MPGLEYGLRRAFSEVISGFVMAVIVEKLAEAGLLDYSYVFTFKLLMVAGIMALIAAMPYWGILYLLGWMLGLLLLLQGGLISIFEFLIYFVPPLLIFGIRVMRSF
jgi:hypothetical protein